MFKHITADDLDHAAGIIRRGGLVAFPTETVYGLGANALNRDAVRRIFAAKGRPATSPLIVHVSSVEMARQITAEWPEAAQKLADAYWPGPLTLVLKKSTAIPNEVTAGLDTVGVRMPAHPVAAELIRRSGVPVAAPSANRFTQLSPTTAEHVHSGLGERIDLILDGGPCEVGIESTVLSLAGGVPVLLRPGFVSQAALEEISGPLRPAPQLSEGAAQPSPGMHPRHYAPRTPLYVLCESDPRPAGRGRFIQMPAGPSEFAAALYAELHRADREGWDWIAVRRPPDTPEWTAIHDRLRRASSPL